MLTRRSALAGFVLAPAAAMAQSALPPPPPPATPAPLDDLVSPGVVRSTLILWGDRVEPDSPVFSPAGVTVQAASRQFGWDAMLAALQPQVPGEDGVKRAILTVAHPAPLARMLPSAEPSLLGALQGASVLNLEEHGGAYLIADGGYQTRRLTAGTLCRMSGRQLGDPGDAARGPIDPSTGAPTPWGTVLFAEGGAGRGLYVVEIDPRDPETIPVKRATLGRFARSGLLATQSADGRAVVFMTDARDGRLLRFISRAPVSPDGGDALDEGQIGVAVLGSGALRFAPVEDGNTSQGTPLDRAAGMALSNRSLLLACRGGQGFIAGSALAEGNPAGRILEIRPEGGDMAGDRFTVDLALSGGDTDMGGPVVIGPECLAAGLDGAVWIGSQDGRITLAEADFTRLRVLYRAPRGAAIGGITLIPGSKSAFAAIRHPGATPDANWVHPATAWPQFLPGMPPRTTVVNLRLG